MSYVNGRLSIGQSSVGCVVQQVKARIETRCPIGKCVQTHYWIAEDPLSGFETCRHEEASNTNAAIAFGIPGQTHEWPAENLLYQGVSNEDRNRYERANNYCCELPALRLRRCFRATAFCMPSIDHPAFS
jgi:hypothetical protein